MKKLGVLAVLFVAALSLMGCQKGEESAAPETLAQLPAKLVMTAIPDDNAENMREFFGLIAAQIEKATGIPCEYVHVDNYAASVTALATGQAHLSWFGAVTAAQAYMQMRDNLRIVAARDIDKEFVSYFIANADLGLDPVDNLQELAQLAEDRGWSFTFGSKSSTSSHLMPRSFFTEQSGQRPEQVFRTVAYSGSHDVVLQKVANGEFHIGALGQPPYDRAAGEVKAKAPIIYTTPKFTNYCFAARADLGDELLEQIRSVLINLHDTAEGQKILGYLKAGRFVDADISEWMGYVELIETGVDIGG
ncbi:phosphonate transport system substrate-binding protein [Geoalkalibacter ferrihydriticus]|uniref:Phosphonate ABC transporter substrate-binding protein n=2 Tax=Geoalkalibacter ferrihydriticus TaxID=392333 RepID=A0A0C2HVT0_9BACT|nr:phosphate/phosphite/phosphonate ABC transporter substrate-binding protein [Geoalkalibacter ferrihydriticus]KIH76842.1 phosphonate ABC transporter substrate-binding protein [Geoalkalibacter ferrihydriticus DSM 17813]SDL48262.1 phosphonate transport system substrate-binding protein [Geoalkalibacter ferrihydriticus]